MLVKFLLRIKNFLVSHPKLGLGAGFALAILVFLNFYIIQPALFLYGQAQNIKLTIRPVIAANNRKDVKTLDFELKYFKTQTIIPMQKAVEKIKIFSFVPFLGDYFRDLDNVFKAGLESYDTITEMTTFLVPLMPQVPFAGLSTNAQTPLRAGINTSEILRSLPSISQELAKYKDHFRSISQKILALDENRYPKYVKGRPVGKYIGEIKDAALLVNNYFDDLLTALSVAPEFAGIGSPKSYLVIIQNDKELRPGGGLMGGYAYLSMKDGEFKLVKSGDMTFIDEGARATRPGVPADLAGYLGTRSLYARDANYSPNLKQTAQNLKQILSSTANALNPDVIIIIDTQMLKSLLSTLGEVKLDGGQVISKDNADEVFRNFFGVVGDKSMNSRKYKDLTSTLLNELLKKVFYFSTYNAGGLLERVLTLGEGKHFFLYVDNQKLDSLAQKYNLTGTVKDSASDYLMVNSAVFSPKRINWDITQTVIKGAEDDGGKIISSLTVETEAKPLDAASQNLAEAKFLVRVYVPQGSSLISSAGARGAVETREELGKTVFYAPVALEAGKKSVLEIKYKTPVPSGGKYTILVQKQAGTADFKYKVSFGGKTQEFNLSRDKVIEL